MVNGYFLNTCHWVEEAPVAVPKLSLTPSTRKGSQTYLLQGGCTQFNGDVLELPVLLCAKVADDIRVLIRFSKQLDLTVCKAETLREDPLHSHIAVVKHASVGQGVVAAFA